MQKKYKGLSEAEVRASREKHGTNELFKRKSVGFFARFFDNLSDPIIRILLIALGLEVLFTLGNCNFIEIGGIVAAILIATVVSTLSECASGRAFARMIEENERSVARVVRGGRTVQIPSGEIVVGDLLLLSAGDKVEADGVMLDGAFEVDQSALNGEREEAEKRVGASGGWELSARDKVFRGSLVTSGEGVIRVGRVGEDTYYGMVARDVQAETRESPLKLRLGKLAGQISKIGYVVAILVGLTYVFRAFVVDNHFNPKLIAAALMDGGAVLSTLIHALTLMITVVVVAVPEGLPMMITVVLSANMKRMIKDNILVKKLVGIETAGSLNILFTDKTGTLTEGRLSLDAVVTEDRTYRTFSSLSTAGRQYDALAVSAIYNTAAERDGKSIIGGNATDRAIAEFFLEAAVPDVRIEGRVPFSSEIKYSSITLDNGTTMHKGAPDVILPRCAFALRTGGEVVASGLSFARAKYKEATERGERVIAVAIQDKGSESYTFVALMMLKDKIREGVKDAVSDALSAGIQVVMVTGDAIETASAIAEECGFFSPRRGHVAITSDALGKMSDAELSELLPRLRVVARALPQDKTRLVRVAEEAELVTGMTGDGVNDAPSLKLADVGFAMGGGTDIAKGAGDVIIIDNSFRSITKTVLYGRTIFKSIRKFITFQLIMNLAACGITLLGPFMGIENPITIIQMLWVNIIMDTLGGLAFAGEPPLSYYMKEPPKRRDEPIISRGAILHVLFNGGFTLGLLILFLTHPYFAAYYSVGRGDTALLTAFYALFIFAGIFNCLSARCERLFIFSNIGKNRPFVLIMLLISTIQIFIIYFGGELFRSTPLTAGELLLALGCAASVLLFDTIRRVISRLA